MIPTVDAFNPLIDMDPRDSHSSIDVAIPDIDSILPSFGPLEPDYGVFDPDDYLDDGNPNDNFMDLDDSSVHHFDADDFDDADDDDDFDEPGPSNRVFTKKKKAPGKRKGGKGKKKKPPSPKKIDSVLGRLNQFDPDEYLDFDNPTDCIQLDPDEVPPWNRIYWKGFDDFSVETPPVPKKKSKKTVIPKVLPYWFRLHENDIVWGIDPGKRDIFVASDGNGHERNQLRTLSVEEFRHMSLSYAMEDKR